MSEAEERAKEFLLEYKGSTLLGAVIDFSNQENKELRDLLAHWLATHKTGVTLTRVVKLTEEIVNNKP